MPIGIKNPLLKGVLEDLVYNTIDEAKQALKNELAYFYNYKSKILHLRLLLTLKFKNNQNH